MEMEPTGDWRIARVIVKRGVEMMKGKGFKVIDNWLNERKSMMVYPWAGDVLVRMKWF